MNNEQWAIIKDVIGQLLGVLASFGFAVIGQLLGVLASFGFAVIGQLLGVLASLGFAVSGQLHNEQFRMIF